MSKEIASNNPSRISILARLVPAFSYAVPMLGASLSAQLLVRVMMGIENAGAVGLGSVVGGMSEASFLTVVALYFALIVGVIGIVVMIIRLLMITTTASPSGWFYLMASGLSYVPLALFWHVDSLLAQGISGRRGVIEVASTIKLGLALTPITAVAIGLILLVVSVVPLPSVLRAKRRWAPILVLVLMELAMIGMAIAFQMRTSWFHRVANGESF